MKEKFSSLRHYAALALSVLLVIALLLPVMQIDTEEYPFSTSYLAGSFTASAERPETVTVSVPVVIETLLNIGDIWNLYSYQTNEVELSELLLDSHASTSEIEEVSKQLSAAIENMGEDGAERIQEKLKDGGFMNSVTLVYVLASMLDVGRVDSELAYTSAGTMVAGIFCMGVSVMSIIASTVFFFILLVRTVKKLLHFIKNSQTPENLDFKLMIDTHTAESLVMCYGIAYILTAFAYNNAFSLGFGAILLFIGVLLLFTLRAGNYILSIEDPVLRHNTFIKQALTFGSCLLLLVFLTTCGNMQYVQPLLGGEVDSFWAVYGAATDKDTAEGASMGVFVAIFLMGFLLPILGGVLLTNNYYRLGLKYNKNKQGGELPSGTMPAVPIFMLICSIVPLFFNVSSEEAVLEGYKNGQFKMILESDQSGCFIFCTVLALALIALEIAYKKTPAIPYNDKTTILDTAP